MQHGVLGEIEQDRDAVPFPAADHDQVDAARLRDPYHLGLYVAGVDQTFAMPELELRREFGDTDPGTVDELALDLHRRQQRLAHRLDGLRNRWPVRALWGAEGGLALILIAGFATSASAFDWRLECYADSTLAGQPGFLLASDDPSWATETLFAFEEEGHIRIFASRYHGEDIWNFFPEGALISPAPGDGVGASWTTFPDGFGNPATSTLEAFENLTVPAGTLFSARCVHRPDIDPSTINEVMHWVDGVGMISDYYPGDGADVLTSYNIAGGSGYFPLAVGNWWEWDFILVASPVGDTPAPATLLYPCVPNPFNPRTDISFEMAAAGHASLRVYDASGRLVKTLINGQRETGRHTVTWDGRDEAGRSAAAGVYWYRFEAGKSEQTRTMTLIK